MKIKKNKLVVLLMAYNEEKNIGQVIQKIPYKVLKNNFRETRILVIDDGSQDKTVQIAKSCGAEAISLGENRRVGFAFNQGLEETLKAQADVLVNIDADGQLDPREIPKLIQPILGDQADLVLGSRFVENKKPPNMSRIKFWGNRQVAKLIGRLTGRQFSDVSCGFRAYNQQALLNLNLFGKFTYTHETILDLANKNLKIIEVPINVTYDKSRKSRVVKSILNYLAESLKIIFRFSLDYKPLRTFGFLGAIIFSFGLVCDIGLLIYYFSVGMFSPYKFVGYVGGFLNGMGIIVIFIGFIGDMLGRIRLNQEKIIMYEKSRILKQKIRRQNKNFN